jgi:osmotically inducible lipoprotein OsmB
MNVQWTKMVAGALIVLLPALGGCTLGGAAAGGVIGHEATHGSTAGTVGGAVVGGVIGHELGK